MVLADYHLAYHFAPQTAFRQLFFSSYLVPLRRRLSSGIACISVSHPLDEGHNWELNFGFVGSPGRNRPLISLGASWLGGKRIRVRRRRRRFLSCLRFAGLLILFLGRCFGFRFESLLELFGPF